MFFSRFPDWEYLKCMCSQGISDRSSKASSCGMGWCTDSVDNFQWQNTTLNRFLVKSQLFPLAWKHTKLQHGDCKLLKLCCYSCFSCTLSEKTLYSFLLIGILKVEYSLPSHVVAEIWFLLTKHWQIIFIAMDMFILLQDATHEPSGLHIITKANGKTGMYAHFWILLLWESVLFNYPTHQKWTVTLLQNQWIIHFKKFKLFSGITD